MTRAKKGAVAEAVSRELELRAIGQGFENALDWVEKYIEGGGTYTKLGREIKTAQGLDSSEEVIRAVVRRVCENLGPDAPLRLQGARVHAGNAFAEDTDDIADSATEADVRVSTLRIEQKKWRAGTLNPALRPNQGVSISISLGAQHIDALRHRAMPAQAHIVPGDGVKSLPSQVVEAEEVS